MKSNFTVLAMVTLLSFSSIGVNNSSAGIIPLEVGYNDPTINQGNTQKSPVLVPRVSIEDNILTFDASCLGCELRLFDEDGVLVYTATIMSNELEFPSYLEGEYEFQIVCGIYYFYGYIEL